MLAYYICIECTCNMYSMFPPVYQNIKIMRLYVDAEKNMCFHCRQMFLMVIFKL